MDTGRGGGSEGEAKGEETNWNLLCSYSLPNSLSVPGQFEVRIQDLHSDLPYGWQENIYFIHQYPSWYAIKKLDWKFGVAKTQTIQPNIGYRHPK